jgi:hypothetical protein
MTLDQIIIKISSTKSSTLLQIDPRTNGPENSINVRSVCRTFCGFFGLLKYSQIYRESIYIGAILCESIDSAVNFWSGT